MDLLTQEDVKTRCVDALLAVGASKDQSQFYSDALHLEYETLHVTYLLLAELREQFDSSNHIDVSKLVAFILKLSSKFNRWRSELDVLTKRSASIRPLNVDKQKVMKNKLWTALCSLETKQVKMTEGDEVEITDTSLANLIKIRNGSTGDEGYIPSLNLVLPSPDSNPRTTIERLQIQLLVCWTDCEIKLKSKLYQVMTSLATLLHTQWKTYSDRHGSNSRGRYGGGYRSSFRIGGGNNEADNEGDGWEAKVIRRIKRIVEAVQDDSCAIDLSRLRKTFCGLENELLRQTSNYLSPIIDTVVNLDKAVLSYQVFRKNWRQFQQILRDGIPPISCVIQLNLEEPNIFSDYSKHIRYYQVTLVAEEVITTEETLETTPAEKTTTGEDETEATETETDQIITSEDEITTSWRVIENEPIETETTDTETFSTETETFSTEETSSTSHVKSRRIVIRAVIDPRDGLEISMKKAVAAGIIDQTAGVYRNVKTRAVKSIQEAMNDGQILMEFVTTAEDAQHGQTSATETSTNETPPPSAKKDLPPVKKDKIDSIGLITIRSQVDSCECTLTGVLDAKTGERMDVEEARQKGILNDADGYYVNSQTGQHVLMNDAIRAGWVLAEFDSGMTEPWEQQETKTYVINAVVDQNSYKPVPFGDAVRCGLIDRRTGCYVDSRSGEKVQAGEAIRRGLFKAVVVDDASALNVDGADRDVVNQVSKAKRDAMRGVKVIGTIKNAHRGPKNYRYPN